MHTDFQTGILKIETNLTARGKTLIYHDLMATEEHSDHVETAI